MEVHNWNSLICHIDITQINNSDQFLNVEFMIIDGGNGNLLSERGGNWLLSICVKVLISSNEKLKENLHSFAENIL